MRISECPEGRLLTDTSSLAATGFQEMRPVSGALASEGDALTGIKRADTANEIQDRAGTSSEVCSECPGALRAR